MSEEDFKRRTKGFAVEVVRFIEELPRSRSGDVLSLQLLRSATAVGANYRSACRARSRRDMIAKLRLVEEEADESIYWMELMEEIGMVRPEALSAYRREADELIAMTVASIKTLLNRPSEDRE